MLNRLLSFYSNSFLVGLFFLAFMSLARVGFYFYYTPKIDLEDYWLDILHSFFLGFRLDLTVVGYSFVLPFFVSILFYSLKKDWFRFSKYYFFLCFVVIVSLIGADFGFYSYFKEHINILFFGLFDDDTKALLVTFWDDYNVPLILGIYIFILFVGYKLISFIFQKEWKFTSLFGLKNIFVINFFLFVFLFLIIRGTFGMFPLGKMLPNISEQSFINKTSQNPIRSFVRAYNLRQKFFSKNYDLIKDVGFKNRIEEAFKIHSSKTDFDTSNLLNNIKYKTSKDIEDGLNVVVVMVESFGLPLFEYSSSSFDIAGALKKHFDEDILFTNFISSGDGTIPSLESLMLNITYRPGSFPFSQSTMKSTSFDYSPAFVYAKKGYETSFVYGGDLSWRDIGSFASTQGYQSVEGKMSIYSSVNKDSSKEYFHPWGIFDEFLFEHIQNKLANSEKPQFIFALTTNNHPPYKIPKQYNSSKLTLPAEFKPYMLTDIDMMMQKSYSYQYAIDQVGRFLDRFKKSKFAKNTIIAITADNNTIDGVMTYPDKKILNSKRVPLMLYIPKRIKKGLKYIDTKAFGSHKDIFPTLYNLTLSETEYLAVGSNLFDKNSKKIGFNGSKVVASKDGVFRLNSFNDKDNNSSLYYKATLAVQEYLIKSYSKQ
jgi:phosphoglycerol transferase MdoB-like AlkP superfamily enzyme